MTDVSTIDSESHGYSKEFQWINHFSPLSFL